MNIHQLNLIIIWALLVRLSMLSKIGIILLLLSTLVGSLLAAQCAQDEESLCVFTCNGTRFNLTEVFQYP